MIHQALSAIVETLNACLKRAAKDDHDRAILSTLVDQAGVMAFTGDNKVVCTLVNMEQESLSAYPGNRQYVRTNPPIHLNLYLLFSCYYPGDTERPTPST